MQVVAEDERMVALFLRLDLVPVGEARKAFFLEVVGERKVQVGRIQFLVDLVVQKLVHTLVHDASFGAPRGAFNVDFLR